MNYDIYRYNRTAVLFAGVHQSVPTDLSGWGLADLDAFFENLDMWATKGTTTELLFSKPTAGIPQHLANSQDKLVGVAGECLSDASLLAGIRAAYHERGYDVVIVQDGNHTFLPCNQDNKVKITWD